MSQLCCKCVAVVSQLCHSCIAFVSHLYRICVAVVLQMCRSCVALVSHLCHSYIAVVLQLCHSCVAVVSSIFAHTTQGEQLGTVKVCIEHYQVTYELRGTNRALIGHQQGINRAPTGCQRGIGVGTYDQFFSSITNTTGGSVFERTKQE